MLPEAAWKATLGELELQMTRATFNTWLRGARLVDYSEGTFVIGVKNDYARDWLEKRLHLTIQRTLQSVSGEGAGLRFVTGQPAARRTASSDRSLRPPNGAAATRAAAGLREAYTFDSFVVGASNRLAHAAALAVAERPGQAYNPLFIYGGVGLGKTHLLHAIGHRCRRRELDVRYVTSETFTNDLIHSIRSQTMDAFRERYRTPDILLIDDVQFIAGKESTQEEMFHTFNDLHRSGKQVILSSDRAPKAMNTLEERLQSRFEWGLLADIQLPTSETRLAILRAKAERLGLPVSEAVLEFVAATVRSNIREMEGALTRLLAHADLTGAPADLALARHVLAAQSAEHRPVTVTTIISAVASHYRLSEQALCGAGRSRTVALPRQVCMYLARTETNASYPQIGSALGNRDHTTILYGYGKIAAAVERDPHLKQETETIRQALHSARVS